MSSELHSRGLHRNLRVGAVVGPPALHSISPSDGGRVTRGKGGLSVPVALVCRGSLSDSGTKLRDGATEPLRHRGGGV